MSATPGLETDSSSGRIGRVFVANAYVIAGPLGVTPTAQIAVDGSDPAFQQPSSGTVQAIAFPGRVVAIGPAPGDYSGDNTATDSLFVRQHGAGTLTLPATPWDGMRVVFLDADGVAQTASLNVAANAGQTVQNPYNLSTFGSNVRVLVPYQCLEFAWDAAATTWRVVADSRESDLPVVSFSGPVSFSFVGRGSAKISTAGGAVTATMTSTPTEGMRVRVKDIGGSAGTNNITIAAAGSGWTIQPVNSTGAAPAASCVISNNHAGAQWVADVANKVWWAECIL